MTPDTPLMDTLVAERPPQSFGQIARATFLSWEKLRIAFVLVLAIETVLLWLNLKPGQQPSMIGTVLVGAVFANLCYFAGPATETYVRWLGLSDGWALTLRSVCFIAGLVFTMLLALMCFIPPF